MRALEKWHRFEPGTNLRAWLFRIATNAFLTNKRRARTTPMGDAMYEVPGTGLLQRRESRRENFRINYRGPFFGSMTPSRTVFVLRANEDMPFSEISAILGITETTALAYVAGAATTHETAGGEALMQDLTCQQVQERLLSAENVEGVMAAHLQKCPECGAACGEIAAAGGGGEIDARAGGARAVGGISGAGARTEIA